MNKKTVAIFAGSQEINDSQQRKKLSLELMDFLQTNKEKIGKIIYGGGTYGVMKQVLDAARKVGIIIEGYSIERYRKYDEGNGVDITFFEDDEARIKEFSNNGDLFIALPGGKGTIKEVLSTSDAIHELGEEKHIFVPSMFIALFNLFWDLDMQGMLHKDDQKLIMTINYLSEIKLDGN